MIRLPRKRTILAIHRWLGLAAAVFLVLVSLTGLALNHTERLGLDRITVRNAFILERYGMASHAGMNAYSISGYGEIVYFNGQLFFDDQRIGSAGGLTGVALSGEVVVLAAPEALFYLSPGGELIERVGADQLPYGRLTAVGRTESGVTVLVADNGNWVPDADWLDFSPYTGPYAVDPLVPVEMDADLRQRILEGYQGAGVPLYRVLLDLHSGRLFGWGGRTLMDLTAVAVLLLVSSGIMGWLRKSRRPANGPSL